MDHYKATSNETGQSRQHTYRYQDEQFRFQAQSPPHSYHDPDSRSTNYANDDLLLERMDSLEHDRPSSGNDWTNESAVRQFRRLDLYQQAYTSFDQPPAMQMDSHESFGNAQPCSFPHIAEALSPPLSRYGVRTSEEQIFGSYPNHNGQQTTNQNTSWNRSQHNEPRNSIKNSDHTSPLPRTQLPQNYLDSSRTSTIIVNDPFDIPHEDRFPSDAYASMAPLSSAATLMSIYDKDALIPMLEETTVMADIPRLSGGYEKSNSTYNVTAITPGLPWPNAADQPNLAEPSVYGTTDQVERRDTPIIADVPAKASHRGKRVKRRYTTPERADIAYKRKHKLVCDRCRQAHRKVCTIDRQVWRVMT